MTKQLTIDEILDNVYLYGMNGGLGYNKFFDEMSPKEAKQALKALVTEMVNEIIGEGEAHVSHVCPRDSIPCREFAARGQLRHEIRQRAKAKIERRFK